MEKYSEELKEFRSKIDEIDNDMRNTEWAKDFQEYFSDMSYLAENLLEYAKGLEDRIGKFKKDKIYDLMKWQIELREKHLNEGNDVQDIPYGTSVNFFIAVEELIYGSAQKVYRIRPAEKKELEERADTEALVNDLAQKFPNNVVDTLTDVRPKGEHEMFGIFRGVGC